MCIRDSGETYITLASREQQTSQSATRNRIIIITAIVVAAALVAGAVVGGLYATGHSLFIENVGDLGKSGNKVEKGIDC